MIGEPLALGAFDGKRGAASVTNAKFYAGVVPEIELGQIPLKMLAIHVLISADQTAFENAEKVFEGVGVNVAPGPLKLGMINAFVR